MVNIEVWGARGSTCTDRGLFTAAELGVPVDFHAVDVKTGQHKSEEFLKRQPFGKVPAAEVDGTQFYESRAIARVIARSTPAGEAIFPSSDLKRVALFEQWASLEVGTITPILEKVVMERVFKPLFRGVPGDEAAAKKSVEDGQQAFAVLDKQLASNEYVIGDFSLIDIYLATYFAHFVNTPEGKETLEKYTNIAAWTKRLLARPAWQKVVAERQQK